jgi:hypothetical protein
MTTGFTKKIKLIVGAIPVEKSIPNDLPHFPFLDIVVYFNFFVFRSLERPFVNL